VSLCIGGGRDYPRCQGSRAFYWLLRTAFIFLFLCTASDRAFVQGLGSLSTSYITPFPQTDRYQVRVLGDWLGSGLASGLQDAFKNDPSVQISDMSRPGYGLVRAEQNDVLGEADRMIAAAPVHIAVIAMGVNDRLAFRTAAGRAQPGSEEWRELYGKEAEKLVKKLRAANIAVYWVGLPVMGNALLNDFIAVLNDTVRQAAYLSGAKFVETSAGFTDQLGAYSAFGPDLQGQTKRLREADGIGLTPAGNRKLANYVEIALRRDLAQARAQRNVPLVGDEEEQARVVPGSARAAPGQKNLAAATTAQPEGQVPDPKRGDASANKTETAAKPGSVTRNDLTPQLSPAQEAARREQAAFAGGGGPQGEFILADLGNALTSIAVISPVSDLSIRELQRQTPLTDRLYFKVLSKGEALPSKQGRADDFRWQANEPPPQTR
jgi:uncharacterized protein